MDDDDAEKEVETASPRKSREKDDAIVKSCRDRLKTAFDAFNESRECQLDDLKFAAGSPDNHYQWPDEVYSQRTSSLTGESPRPTLTVNKLPQHIRQVTNDQRMNPPGGKILPVDDKGDPAIAELFTGMIRSIEALSNSAVVYSTASDNQVTHGEGYWRIITTYADENSFEQDIRLLRIRNPFSVWLDPMAQDPAGEDATWGLVTEDMTHAEFERTYPKAEIVSALKDVGFKDPMWVSEKTIKIAEYFYKEYDPVKLYLFEGNVVAIEGQADLKMLREQLGPPIRERIAQRPRVCWVKTNGYAVLEKTVWPGSYIPIVRVIGNEYEIEGKIELSGIVRNAKDAQRMYNYWTSQEAEMLALAPKAPFVGYQGQFKDPKWKNANVKNYPYLEVAIDIQDNSNQPLPLPQRAAPPMPQTGILQAKLGSAEDIKATTGQYDASLGMVSNERSGKAIQERKRESDTGTYHYTDNMAQAIRYSTKQLVELIPKIYDTRRVARIVGLDNEVSLAQLDPEQEKAVVERTDEQGNVIEKIYNPNVGKYDVVPTTGPGYETKRQEARESMSEILQASPEMWKVAGDLFVKNLDWPGAQEFAKRLKKTIAPELLDDNDSPALLAARKQIEAMGQEMEQLHQMLKNVQNSIEMHEQKRADYEAQIKAYDAETKRLSSVAVSLTPEQVQDIVMGTIDAMRAQGDLLAGEPQMQPMQGMPQ